jgi:hypothetical protein
MLEVFNRCLKEGRFPRVWKQAEIAWIPKPGGSGLRPVCLLPTIGKVYDKILATRLTYHLEVKGRLSDRQFGFRKGRGTIAAIDKAVESLRKAKTESKHAIMVAFDIKNAFNSAWYPALVQLLARSGCPGDLGRAIADFLQDRSVTSEGVTVRTSRGCPQGSCLGPILWLLIMEDWFAGMDEVRPGEDVRVEVQAFADDQVVLISASSLAKLEAAWDKTWAACQQTGVRPREDDRHLCSGQIRLGQVRTEQEDARQEEPKAPNGKRQHPDRGSCEVLGGGHRQRSPLGGTRQVRSREGDGGSAQGQGSGGQDLGYGP